MDMLMVAVGTPMPNMGFTPGTPGDCTSGAGTICFYANANGYNGTGLTANSSSNSVNWLFPSSVPSVTTPSSSLTAYPFLKVVVSENVKTHFLYTIHGTSYQQVAAACTCGLTGTVPQAAPILVLNPTIPEALHLSGGSHIVIVGGPNNSIQVNSSANGAPNTNSTSNAVYCDGGSGYPVDTTLAGPNGTGGYLSIHGGPTSNQYCGANYILNDVLNGLPAGKLWKSPVATFADPYSSVPQPSLPPAPVAASHPVPGAPVQPTTQGTWVATGTDSCPNTNPTQHYLTYSAQYGNVYGNCLEFNPGYYPSGIDLTSLAGYSSDVAIFMPGIYYLNGNLHVGSSATIRNAWVGLQPSTQGVMFYFISGGPVFDGGSGQPSSYINTVPSYYLNCTGTTGSSLMPSSLAGNVLASQCTVAGHLRRRSEHRRVVRCRKSRTALQFGVQRCVPGHCDWRRRDAEFHRGALFSQRHLSGSGNVERRRNFHILSVRKHRDGPAHAVRKRHHQNGTHRGRNRKQFSCCRHLAMNDARTASESQQTTASLSRFETPSS